jgi:TonB-linked SusC/RagA family outer membrane protein
MKMIRIIGCLIYVVMLSTFSSTKVTAGTYRTAILNYSALFQEPTDDTTKLDSIKMVSNRVHVKGIKDSLNIRLSEINPNISLQQLAKGSLSGVYVQETTGEPGAEQSMLIRGLSSPLFTTKDIYTQQPVVYVNGIPLIQESNFVYDIQKYNFNRIGPANNLLSIIDISNISSIEVIKDPAALAQLGPIAAHGAIWITTKPAKSGYRELSINSYFGMTQASNITPVNAQYENNFRKPFYQRYATSDDYLNYVGYLRDSTNVNYYGPARWNDLYYKNTPIYSLDLGLTGGSERANFRFFGSATQNASNADDTDFKRYGASFQINMAPFSWFTVSSVVNANRLDRKRNRSLRDRFAETRYIPDLYNPLSPNADSYQDYLNEHEKSLDDNRTISVQGSLALKFNLNPLKFVTSLNFDYNQGIRDAFFPTTLMEGNNFVSNYYGFNQRMLFNNFLSYTKEINKDHQLTLEGGFSIQEDQHKYNYATAYNGPNDFIKINGVSGNAGTDYLLPENYLVYRYLDNQVDRLMSFYGSAKYNYKNLLTISALLRDDASTNAQPGSRWFLAPAASAQWNLKNQFFRDNTFFNDLKFDASWSRIGIPFLDNRYAAGPQYRVEIGWDLEPTIPGYNGVAGLSRPYSSGWVGYDLDWAYVDQLNLGLNASFLNNRLNASATFYMKENKSMLINVPVPAESGFKASVASGMSVQNTGFDFAVQAYVVKDNKGFNWTTGLNLNLNRNKLTGLPNGLNNLVIGDTKLTVGESIDKFWIYQNEGIYNADSEVPLNAVTNQPIAFEGTTLKAGDPIWKDINGDMAINSSDKMLQGNYMPKLFGGFTNEFHMGQFDLSFNIIFALGQKALNQTAASQYDFINREAGNDINAIKEIYSWQVNVATDKYPIYNPWSSVVPYRLEQNLFLENASYAKLRSVSIGYDLAKTTFFRKMGSEMRRAYIYVTGNNLVTVTPFSGTDPELINYNGIYNGYALPIPRTFTLGVKLDL